MYRLNSSGLKAAGTTAIKATPGSLHGVDLVPDGANAATIVIYDNASAGSGTVLFSARCAATASVHFNNIDVAASNGITIVLTGTGSGAVIRFK